MCPDPPRRSVRTRPAGILLAAGTASRFGADKMLASFRGQPLVRHAAETLASAGLDPVLVLVPRLEGFEAALTGLRLQLIVNPDAALGMATSIRAGVLALPGSVEAVVIALGDQPTASVEQIEQLVERHTRGSAVITTSEYGDVAAPPVIFERAAFEELLALSGDRGAREIVERDPARVERVAFDRMPPDIDRPADLRDLE